RNVDGIETHPNQREQQSVGDEAYDRRKGLAGGDRPNRQAKDHSGKRNLEDRCDGHGGGSAWRAARAMSCEIVAPARRTRSQMQTNLNAMARLSAFGSN